MLASPFVIGDSNVTALAERAGTHHPGGGKPPWQPPARALDPSRVAAWLETEIQIDEKGGTGAKLRGQALRSETVTYRQVRGSLAGTGFCENVPGGLSVEGSDRESAGC